MATFSGALKPKRKGELQDISRALGLQIQSGTKDEYEEAITKTLATNEKLRSDTRFSGLWRPGMKNGPEKHDLREKAATRISRAIDAAETEADRAVAIVNKESREVAKKFESSKVYGAVSKISKDVRVTSNHFAAATQHELSSAWRIVALTVWAELAFVLLTHTHYHQKYHLGPLKWSPFPLVGQNALTLTLPNMTVWWRAAFLKPFGLWILATVVIPLLFAHAIVFPRPEVHSRRSRRRQEPEPASAVTFSIARLATSVFLLKIAPIGLTSDWRYISQFADLQLLAAAVGLAFSLYEAIAV